MRKLTVEFAVGLFVLAGIASTAYLAVRLGDLTVFAKDGYEITARFRSISGLKEGAVIEIAGVRVGTVSKINLDPTDYDAVVHLALKQDVQVQDDAIASIRSTGIIGEKYINIAPGGSDTLLQAGEEIAETESSVSLEELIGKYIFQKE